MNDGCWPQDIVWSGSITANGATYTMSQPSTQFVSAGPTIASMSLVFSDLNVTNLIPGEDLPIGFWLGAGGEYGPWRLHWYADLIGGLEYSFLQLLWRLCLPLQWSLLLQWSLRQHPHRPRQLRQPVKNLANIFLSA